MSKSMWLCAAALSGMMFVGCDQSSTPTGGTTGGTATPGGGVVDKAKEAGAAAADKTAAMADKAKDATAGAFDAIKGQVEKLYADAETAVKGGKIDEAKGLLAQLTAMKDKLPADWVKKLDDLKAMIDKAAALVPGGR